METSRDNWWIDFRTGESHYNQDLQFKKYFEEKIEIFIHGITSGKFTSRGIHLRKNTLRPDGEFGCEIFICIPCCDNPLRIDEETGKIKIDFVFECLEELYNHFLKYHKV